jgi:hypothetical protein
MAQEFKPVAIAGTRAVHRDEARKLAQTIANEDYHVADFQSDRRVGGKPKVKYKDWRENAPSEWGANNGKALQANILQQAFAIGRQTRAEMGGDGLDTLQRALKDGTQPDLIVESKKRSMRIW